MTGVPGCAIFILRHTHTQTYTQIYVHTTTTGGCFQVAAGVQRHEHGLWSSANWDPPDHHLGSTRWPCDTKQATQSMNAGLSLLFVSAWYRAVGITQDHLCKVWAHSITRMSICVCPPQKLGHEVLPSGLLLGLAWLYIILRGFINTPSLCISPLFALKLGCAQPTSTPQGTQAQ